MSGLKENKYKLVFVNSKKEITSVSTSNHIKNKKNVSSWLRKVITNEWLTHLNFVSLCRLTYLHTQNQLSKKKLFTRHMSKAERMDLNFYVQTCKNPDYVQYHDDFVKIFWLRKKNSKTDTYDLQIFKKYVKSWHD